MDTKNVGYLGFGFAYFPLQFVQTRTQTWSKCKWDQDRTQRALSNALITFSLKFSQNREKSKILSKNNEKNDTPLTKVNTIRPLRGQKAETYTDR